VLGSNSVSVQYHWLRAGAGIGFAHDFALPSSSSLKRIIPDQLSLTRSFYLLRYKEDHRLERMNRLAQALVAGIRAEIIRLEALA
jgi:DNA-binding transcriptional LysR family regulator